ncbi:MAG: WYL domain-containing transcriptional regulator [Clostridia bacterium]|nr:WYL domain-containing transcriptional regulator [Clostridia bacterium]
MAYKELVKSFEKIRMYMRDFYVYGFKTRNDFNKKSLRSYDDEKRRIESYLGNYMYFESSSDGKRVFLSIDSREAVHNPLFKAWKAKSFTDGDITLHFILCDILSKGVSMSPVDIVAEVDRYLSVFEKPMTFDESTVRKKLKEYEKTGIVVSEKQSRKTLYRMAECTDISHMTDMLNFFAEASPLGVIGSFLLDKTQEKKTSFSFKHHYITATMDCGILYRLLCAIHERKSCETQIVSAKTGAEYAYSIVPLRVLWSVQSGRYYCMGYNNLRHRIETYRIDHITDVKKGDVSPDFDKYRTRLANIEKHMWGASVPIAKDKLQTVSFTLFVNEGEEYIIRRLEREKRCGSIEQVDENHYKFTATVADEWELTPWIRTFICRITNISFSDKENEKRFKNDIAAMCTLYGIGGEKV